jgi:flagellin-like hook-associated protein FlgL
MIVVIHSGAFVFSDGSSGKFHSTASNSFNVLATGGVRIVTGATSTAGEATPSAGVTIGAGGGSWTTLSDRNAKDGLTAIDPRNVLAKVGAMPVYTWRYKTEVSRALHMGPTAQDFRAAFGLGDNDKTITTVDEGGVALAALQGLNAKVEEQASTIGGQQREIAELRRMLLELRSTTEVKAAMH